MGGHGPPPKDPSRLAGHGAAKARIGGLRVFVADRVEQPALPALWVKGKNGKKTRFSWPPVTKRWWATWGSEPMAVDFRPTDWDFLLDTALIHARVWGDGELSLLPELRLRVSKMGATCEDRARLRITYAAADHADDRRQVHASREEPEDESSTPVRRAPRRLRSAG